MTFYLAAACTATDTVLYLTAPFTLPFSYPVPMLISNEILQVWGGDQQTEITVERGLLGTIPAAYNAGESLADPLTVIFTP